MQRRLTRYEAKPPEPLEVSPETPTAELRILNRARDRLLADLCCAPRLNDLAAYAGTNRTTLGQIFRAHLGMSVFDYLREQRLAEGRRLLTDSRLTLTAIAGAVGYRYTRDFAWAFKCRFGVSPTAFRERGRSGAGSPTAPRPQSRGQG